MARIPTATQVHYQSLECDEKETHGKCRCVSFFKWLQASGGFSKRRLAGSTFVDGRCNLREFNDLCVHVLKFGKPLHYSHFLENKNRTGQESQKPSRLNGNILCRTELQHASDDGEWAHDPTNHYQQNIDFIKHRDPLGPPAFFHGVSCNEKQA